MILNIREQLIIRNSKTEQYNSFRNKSFGFNTNQDSIILIINTKKKNCFPNNNDVKEHLLNKMKCFECLQVK